MSGNVLEWCSSLYKPYPYKVDDGREDEKAEGSRVLRGGSCDYYSIGMRAADRHKCNPNFEDYYVGVRCARSFDGSEF